VALDPRSPACRLADPGVVYFCTVLRRRPETPDPQEGPYLDTRIFAFQWPRRGWAPVPEAPTEIIEGIDSATGDLVVMARRAFVKRAARADQPASVAPDVDVANDDVPDFWTRDGQPSPSRPLDAGLRKGIKS
jgi:hypothetical protein